MRPVKKVLTWSSAIVVLILGIIFTLLNPEFIALNLGFKVFSIPLVLLLLLVFALGLLLGLVTGLSRALFLQHKKDKQEVALKLKM